MDIACRGRTDERGEFSGFFAEVERVERGIPIDVGGAERGGPFELEIAMKGSLDFERPFEGHNIVDFTMEPKGQATTVTWTMHGPVPFMAKIVHVIFNMDRMVGKDFETGLANLKTLAER